MQTYLDGNLLSWTVPMIPLIGVPLTGSAYRAPNGEVLWIDPPDPGAHEAELLKLGQPSHILVTFRDHDRAVAELARRYGAKVWVPKGQGGSLAADVEFGEDTELPGGLKALSMPAMGYGEHALHTEAYGKRFAFIGDAVFNLDGGETFFLVKPLAFRSHGHGPLRMKRDYRGGDTAAAPGQLQRLLDLKLDTLFLSHGPAVHDADRELRACLGV